MTEHETPSSHGPDLLAAEYVLGVLDVSEREAAETRLQEDADFADAVARWQGRLGPLAAPVSPVSPSPALKRRIEAALFGSGTTETSSTGWLGSLVFWRTTTTVSAVAAAIAIAVNLVQPTGPAGPLEPDGVETSSSGYFAALRDGDAAPVILVRFEPDTGELVLSGPVASDLADPVQPELWIIPPGEAPRSLGLIADTDGVVDSRVPVGAELVAAIGEGAVLAISLEPPGGSPTGAPTGPVIAVGTVQTL